MAVFRDGRREYLHKVLWKEANGPLPEGLELNCIDGNKANSDPSNWEPVSRSVITRISRLQTAIGDDPELRPAIRNLAKLQAELNRINSADKPTKKPTKASR
jgi:HNH endonuclease